MRTGAIWLTRLFGWRDARRVAAAYRELFDPRLESARLVLRDLSAYCHAGQSAAQGDAHQTAVAAGRQDAFWHIAEMVGLRPEDLTQLQTRSEDDE